MYGDVPPPQDVDPFRAAGLAHDATELPGRGELEVEDHGDPQAARVEAAQAEGRRLASEEPLRKGKEDTGPITGEGVGGDGASVLHPAQGADGGLHDVPAGEPREVGHEPDPAGVQLAVGGPHWVPMLSRGRAMSSTAA